MLQPVINNSCVWFTELRGKLRRVEEFSLPVDWVARVVEGRASAVRELRRGLRGHRAETGTEK